MDWSQFEEEQTTSAALELADAYRDDGATPRFARVKLRICAGAEADERVLGIERRYQYSAYVRLDRFVGAATNVSESEALGPVATLDWKEKAGARVHSGAAYRRNAQTLLLRRRNDSIFVEVLGPCLPGDRSADEATRRPARDLAVAGLVALTDEPLTLDNDKVLPGAEP